MITHDDFNTLANEDACKTFLEQSPHASAMEIFQAGMLWHHLQLLVFEPGYEIMAKNFESKMANLENMLQKDPQGLERIVMAQKVAKKGKPHLSIVKNNVPVKGEK